MSSSSIQLPQTVDIADLMFLRKALADRGATCGDDIVGRALSICVLNSSYEGSDSAMKDFDDLNVGPQHYLGTLVTSESSEAALNNDARASAAAAAAAAAAEVGASRMRIEVHSMKKATSYRQIRALVKSGRFDVFYNMCDGAKDEDRAGEDVIRALEEFQVPFTGAPSKCYEPTKPDMKMAVHTVGIRTAQHAIVESVDETRRRCAGMRYPVLIKHISGWSSVGMTKDCKCTSLDALLVRIAPFLHEYQIALVEEFIAGEEVTVLACADDTQPDGVRVFQPVMMSFPEGEDFKHFNLKWCAFDDIGWKVMPKTHPSYAKVVAMGAGAFKATMGGIGYGRTDIRIDPETQEPWFLEINPNCGMLYPPGQEASADWILKLDETTSHAEFICTQIAMALKRHRLTVPMYVRDHEPAKGYYLRASRNIAAGEVIMYDEGRSYRIVTRPFVESHWSREDIAAFRLGAWPLGTDRHVYALWDLSPTMWRPINHSCDPNMAFGENRSLNIVAVRSIAKGDELTMDYTTFCDDVTPDFQCWCGSPNCFGWIDCSKPFPHHHGARNVTVGAAEAAAPKEATTGEAASAALAPSSDAGGTTQLRTPTRVPFLVEKSGQFGAGSA